MEGNMDNECELAGFGTNVNGKPIKCSANIQSHHLLNKSKLSKIFKKNPKAREYVEVKHAEIFIPKVCSVHNADTKLADTPAARRWMTTRDVIDGLQEFLKVPEPSWTYKAIMSAPLP
jgi:hypothetical protein